MFKEFYNQSKGYLVSIVNVAMAIYVTEGKQVFVSSVVNGAFVIIDACINYFCK